MASTPLFSFQDACELLWESFNPATKPPTGRELRMAKAAVVTAYRDLPNVYPWTYYQRRTTFATEADYSTGTVAYDHTAGTYERMLTLTSGTWPTNAARGTVIIDSVHYDVEDRKSDSIITLTANSNPGADVAAGESYVWYRDSYPLPVNFRSIQTIVDCALADRPLEYIPPSSHLFTSREWSGVGDPELFTIRNEGDYIGSLALLFSPAPSSARSYEILYDASPAQLTTYKYSTGTMSCAAASTTVTGSGTAWAQSHVGCVMRFTTSTTIEPTDVVGTVDGTANPYLAQRIVTAVTNSGSLTIDAAVSSTTSLSGTMYTLSDPIDVEPLTMRSYFEALCAYHYARLTKRKDQRDLWAYAQKSLLEAMNSDQRARQIVSAAGGSDTRNWSRTWGTVDYDG